MLHCTQEHTAKFSRDLYGRYLSNRRGHPAEAELRIVFDQILAALEYCHGAGVVHRDIKVQRAQGRTKERLGEQELLVVDKN